MPGVALGHRRLSIIDLAGGRQPLANEDGTVWLVFNGEIYNFHDLRRRLDGGRASISNRRRHRNDRPSLRRRGLDFARASLAACSPWRSGTRGGGSCVLARDRLGKKPLVYRLRARPAAVRQRAEMPARRAGRAARSRSAGDRRISDVSIRAASAHASSAASRKLPPAHYAVWRKGGWRSSRYWQPDFDSPDRPPLAEYAAELARAADRRRAAAAAKRRAAGGVFVRRNRFVARSSG